MSRVSTKRLGILQKRDDMTPEQSVAPWLGTQAKLCKKLPGSRRYSVNLVGRTRFETFGYDGLPESWFDPEGLGAAFASPGGKALLADLPHFTSKIDPFVSLETRMLRP